MLKAAKLYHTIEKQEIVCDLCYQRCRISPEKLGICRVRQNREGKLYTLVYGEIIAAHIDPIEKKPLYHFLPGSDSFSIATRGCNFSCPFCQNWQISQTSSKESQRLSGRQFLPEEIVDSAVKQNCRSISYTYTEPTIYFEYAYDTAKLAAERGLSNIFVTNGYMTSEALDTINPFLDACNVDLKSFRDVFYKKMCRAHLQPVLESIRHMKKLKIWIEITTLVIPGQNDSDEELTGIADFIADVDPNIPWHISRFHPDFKYSESASTPISTLRRAFDIGKQKGLKYIYIGNVPSESEDTICPNCQEILIKRRGFAVSDIKIKESLCGYCGEAIAGVF